MARRMVGRDRPSRRGEVDLVLRRGCRAGIVPELDRVLEVLGDLEVEGHRAAAVDREAGRFPTVRGGVVMHCVSMSELSSM